MNILHLTPSYFPNQGGVETHVKKISEQLTRLGHQVSVLTAAEAQLPRTEVIDDVSIHRLQVTTPDHFKFQYKLDIWQQILKQYQLFLQADVIHVHDVMWWVLPLWIFIWPKLFITFHGWEGKYPVPRRNKLARWIWSKLALRTIHVGKWISEFYWDQPQQVVYGGVDENIINSAKKPSLINQTKASGKQKKMALVFIGRLELENEIEHYLNLIKLLKHDFQVQVTWVGDGQYRQQCSRVGQVTGMVNDAEKYLKKADLVLANSYLSMLTAQALGKIIISFYSHTLKERYLATYPGQKMLLLADSPIKMRQKINQLFQDKATKLQYEQAAQEWAHRQSWLKVAQAYEQLWWSR